MCSKLCSSSAKFLGATIGTYREVEPAVRVSRPDVIAEQRRLRARNYTRTHTVLFHLSADVSRRGRDISSGP